MVALPGTIDAAGEKCTHTPPALTSPVAFEVLLQEKIAQPYRLLYSCYQQALQGQGADTTAVHNARKSLPRQLSRQVVSPYSPYSPRVIDPPLSLLSAYDKVLLGTKPQTSGHGEQNGRSRTPQQGAPRLSGRSRLVVGERGTEKGSPPLPDKGSPLPPDSVPASLPTPVSQHALSLSNGTTDDIQKEKPRAKCSKAYEVEPDDSDGLDSDAYSIAGSPDKELRELRTNSFMEHVASTTSLVSGPEMRMQRGLTAIGSERDKQRPFPKITIQGRMPALPAMTTIYDGDNPVLQHVRSRVLGSQVGTMVRSLSEKFATEPIKPNGQLGNFVCSRTFESLCCMVIMINTIYIAFATNHASSNLEEGDTQGMKNVEILFCIFYTVEILLRIAAFRWSYICSSEWAWNSLDVFLVIISIQEVALTAGLDATNGGGPSMSFLRILRVMKMMKLFRVVRLMRMFRELRLIWSSIVGCVKAIFWALVLIMATSYMVGVCFTQATTGYLRELGEKIDEEQFDRLRGYWGNVQMSMLSLYMCVTNGADWADVADSLFVVGNAYYALFLLYILFYTCVVANTLTSLFVESTIANADKDQQYVIMNALEQSDKIIDKLRHWFEDVDLDGNGYITFEEFCEKLHDPRSVAFASTMNIEVTDLKQFFSVLSVNGSQPVDLETFVVGCIKLRGAAKSMDLMELMYFHRQAVEQARRQQVKFEEFCTAQFETIQKSMHHQQAVMGRERGSKAPSPLHRPRSSGALARGSSSGEAIDTVQSGEPMAQPQPSSLPLSKCESVISA
eukprot:TRINITY_DN2381_c0_g1_i1.p1 TRINITY_DN2381_c0_g1~~TRINITY_DN2381_c0_g1_i1.p1  ORF type:complete len:788 (-),score=160.85 TRINITY_DN2381_c0_g1_i1:470-2833(-)